ncbi:MAG TPA: tetratricopeptide repeat protein [Candidatus Acidoferrum sp.]|nr:tetratricopeptide repeat protein [Candidatus Acidoferrum sp.]
MDSARWQKIQTLFHDAADFPVTEQRTFLESQCADDQALISEVMILLAEDARGSSLLDSDIAQVVGHVLTDPATSPLPFKDFGPYRIVRAIGEGGMGIVYLAEREDLGSQVAIKILRDAGLSPGRRHLFAAEQRTLAQLNHPSIARLYDADTSPDGSPFFVMEYVEGVPLTLYCDKNNCSIHGRLRLFRAVCEAVLYAHQHAVIHRDLKPSNILVKNDETVRLLDFGISKHIESLGDSAGKTMMGLRLMTPAYAAPEQIRGEQVGIHSDVYSLGVILYELLAGRLPIDFSNLTPAQAEKILTQQETEKPSAAADRFLRLPQQSDNATPASKAEWADLDVLCLTAMHKDPQRRYRSVEALIRDIDHFLEGEPLEAQPDTLAYRLRKFVRRNRQPVAAGAVAFALVVGLVTFFTVRLAIARNTALAEAARTQRIQKFMTNLFQGGDESAGPADSLRVVTLLDRGVQEAQSLNGEPEVQAELYETLGTLYQKLGKLDQANRLLNTSLQERKTLYGGDAAQVAESLVALGLLRADQAQLPEAEKLVREGLAMSKRHLPPNHPAVAKATTALGIVLEDRGSYDEAIKSLEEAVHLQSAKGAATPEAAASLYELASTHFYAGHYDISESLNERLLAMYRQIYGERHPRVADVLINLGAIKYDLGHYPEAEKYDRQALDIVQAWYGKDNPETASDLTILARALIREDRYDEAVDLLQQSLAIKERVYGKVHPTVASSLNELGTAALRKGKNEAAEQYFSRMVGIYRKVYGEHHYLFAVALSNLGSVYSNREEWSRAEKIYRQVIPIFTESQSANHINTGVARIKLGRALLHQNRYAEAEAETRAGYEILIKQMDPKVSWLVNARKDLAEEYDALRQPLQATQFRAEAAALDSKPSDSAKK